MYQRWKGVPQYRPATIRAEERRKRFQYLSEDPGLLLSHERREKARDWRLRSFTKQVDNFS